MCAEGEAVNFIWTKISFSLIFCSIFLDIFAEDPQFQEEKAVIIREIADLKPLPPE